MLVCFFKVRTYSHQMSSAYGEYECKSGCSFTRLFFKLLSFVVNWGLDFEFGLGLTFGLELGYSLGQV